MKTRYKNCHLKLFRVETISANGVKIDIKKGLRQRSFLLQNLFWCFTLLPTLF